MYPLRSKPFFKTLSSERKLTIAEAKRAIYIDFEGFMYQAPSLVGIECEDEFKQIIFSKNLELAAKAKGLEVANGKEVIASLLLKAQAEGRKIIAYSSFEKEQCWEWYQTDISQIYVNANLIAKDWKKVAHPNVRIKGLKDFLKLVGYSRGDHLGIKQSTQRIDSVAKMLLKRGDYDSLTKVVKAKWTKLLDHNKIDVEGMKFLMLSTFIKN